MSFLIKKSTLIYVLYILVLIFPCTELALRILGYEPYRQVEFHIEARPNNCIIADSSMGFALHPGHFDVTINEGLNYSVTHTNDSQRISSYDSVLNNLTDSIYFFGCSYTYGMGVDDSLTYPFLVQQTHTNSLVQNFGVPGYGTIQSYLQLEQLIATNNHPTVAVINYAHFHDDRNALTPAYRRDLYLGYQQSHQSVGDIMQAAHLPFIQKQGDFHQIASCSWQNIYDNWSYRTTFSLVNLLQDIRDHQQAKNINSKAATLYIFKQIQDLCQQHQIRLIVTGITSSTKTQGLLQELSEQGIETLDISVDLSLGKYNNAPYDDHPNSLAHAIYAERLTTYLATFVGDQ